MRNTEKIKTVKQKKRGKQPLENLLAFFYALRWGAWLLMQFQPLANLWANFLAENSAGMMLEELFTTGALGTAWNGVVNGLMGKTGTILFVILLAVDWCYEHFPTTEVNQIINQIRYVRNTPKIMSTIQRSYVRVIYDALGKEALLDIGSFHSMPLNEDGTLQLVMEKNKVGVIKDGQRILSLPVGRWCEIPGAGIRLKYIKTSYKVQ